MFLYMLMVTALVAAAMGSNIAGTTGSDLTLTPGAKGADIVEQTMKVIMTSCVFDDDKLFMRRLAYVESNDGLNPDTYHAGYHGGIWQVDEYMFNKIKEPQNIQALSQYTSKIQTALGITWLNTIWWDCRKPLFSALAARLYIQLENQSFPRNISQQAYFWIMVYRNGNDANTFINKVNNLNKGCKVNAVDLVFVLDSSGSVGSGNFNKMKKFVKDVAKAFNIGENKTRVGVLSYSSTTYKNFFLKSHKTQAAVEAAVNSIGYVGGGTSSHLALDDLRKEMFSPNNGARAGVPQVGIFLTDGYSNDRSKTIVSAKKVHDADITMFSIGVGSSLDKTELEAIASDPDCLHCFTLKNFKEVESLTGAIEKGACEAPVIANSTDDAVKIDSTVSDNQNFKIPLYDVTILQINVTIGWVTVYISYTTYRYPSEAYYDVKHEATPNHPAVIHLQKPSNNSTGDVVYCNIKNNAGNNTASVVEVGIIPDDKSHCKGVDCKNGGVCVDDLQNNYYRCYCAPGYEGTHCEQDKDDCQGVYCKNGGTCVDGMNNYFCNCAQGYEGTHCEQDKDDCHGVDCKNGGTCVDGLNDYICNCAQGYEGTHCEQDKDDCQGVYCKNGGTCMDGLNNYFCNCAQGYEGTHCEQDKDDCHGMDCKNGGTCVDGLNDYICSCAQGYEGTHCEQDKDDCQGVYCKNGGTCVDGLNNYFCNCAQGYEGTHCEQDKDDCHGVDCKNGGTCVDGPNDYICSCAQGYEGTHCEQDKDDCQGVYCKNGGTCVDGLNNYFCNCAQGYEGTHCEQDKDDCSGVDCKNGGTCMDGPNDYICNCAQGFQGTHCEQADNSTGTYDCGQNNPCTQDNIDKGNFYFPHADPTKFTQCSEWGQCFVMPCGPGETWDPHDYTCTA